jgi:putative heme-binding domain-containing protein
MSPPVRSRIRDVLLGRASSAKAFLDLIDRGELSFADVPVEQLRPIGLFGDDALDVLVRKHWGNIGSGTPEEKLATMRRYNNDLRAGAGDPANGKSLFAKHCAACHVLHGEGSKVGPDLTAANRTDRAALLANLVDPSAVIRREYLSYVIQTSSGQMLTGLLAEQDAGSITVLDAKNQRFKLPRDQVKSIGESNVSLMPERVLDTLSPQELRDLFSYLEK